MRDSDTNLDWPIALAGSIALVSLSISAGILIEAICRLLGV